MAKKTGLGRGLESLLGTSDQEVGESASTKTLPLSSIHVNKSQPRKHFDAGKIDELCDSIKQNGVLQPILVRKKGASYEIVAGERRFQAAKKAGLKEIPAVVKDITDDEVLKLALIENLQRADLNPLEEALAYRTLLKQHKLTQEQLSHMLSKSRSAISNSMRLLELTDDVQKFVIDGLLSAGHARALLSVTDPEAQIKLAQKVIDEHLSVRETEKLAPLFLGATLEKKPKKLMPQEYKRACHQMQLILKTRVRIKEGKKKNIEIEFSDMKDLARILDALQTIRSHE